MSTEISKRAFTAGLGIGALTLLTQQQASADTPFTTFRFPAAGAPTARTMPERLAEVKNVKDFGAVGDGIADDTPKIQAAIDAAREAGISFGSSYTGTNIYFPSGIYKVTSPLKFPWGPNNHNNIRLTGSGRHSSTLLGNFAGFVIDKPWDGTSATSGQEVESLRGISQLYVKNDSQALGSGAIRARFTRNFEVADCRITGRIGIDGDGASFNMMIRDSEIVAPVYNTGFKGVVMNAGTVTNCRFTGWGKGLVVNSNGVLVAGNGFEVNGTGLVIGENLAGTSSQCNGATIVGNNFESNVTSIHVRALAGGLVAGNETHAYQNGAPPYPSNPSTGILIQSSEFCSYIGNVITLNYGTNAAWDFTIAGGKYNAFINNLGSCAAGGGVNWKFLSSGVPNMATTFVANQHASHEQTVASLPTDSNSGRFVGARRNVSDSSVTSFGSTAAGGGSSHVEVRWNGLNWTVCG